MVIAGDQEQPSRGEWWSAAAIILVSVAIAMSLRVLQVAHFSEATTKAIYDAQSIGQIARGSLGTLRASIALAAFVALTVAVVTATTPARMWATWTAFVVAFVAALVMTGGAARLVALGWFAAVVVFEIVIRDRRPRVVWVANPAAALFPGLQPQVAVVPAPPVAPAPVAPIPVAPPAGGPAGPGQPAPPLPLAPPAAVSSLPRSTLALVAAGVFAIVMMLSTWATHGTWLNRQRVFLRHPTDLGTPIDPVSVYVLRDDPFGLTVLAFDPRTVHHVAWADIDQAPPCDRKDAYRHVACPDPAHPTTTVSPSSTSPRP